MTVSLADGGMGLGTMDMDEQKARQMLTEAGFTTSILPERQQRPPRHST